MQRKTRKRKKKEKKVRGKISTSSSTHPSGMNILFTPPPPPPLLSQPLPPPFNTSGRIFLGKHGTGHLVPETETVPHRRHTHTHTPAWLVLGRFNDTLFFLRHGYCTAMLATQPAPPTIQRLSACSPRPRLFSATTCCWWW